MAKIMGEMARAAARDDAWMPSERFQRYVDENWERLFPKRAPRAIYPDTARSLPAPGASSKEP